jgi:adenine-specific DNA-methyltransferase
MPTLQFKGKNIIWNHHLAVPFHTLDEVSDLHLYPEKANGNMIIEGDNLIALKSLLPQFTGAIKCIYIDPPYNTGNEGWIYNDKVNSPLLKDWLGKEVGGGEDLTRHDKWMCMMTPRLKLLRELLTEDGVIFISIDDNEASNLKILLDEIFGVENFIAQTVVQLNPRGRTLDRFLAKTYEYIFIYGKDAANESTINLLEKTGKALNSYKKKDEIGKYRELELRNRNPVFHRGNRPNLYYPIYVNPENESVSLEKDSLHTVEVLPINSRNVDGCWTWGKDKVENNKNLLVGRKVSTGAWRIYRKDYLVQNGQKALTKEKALWIDKEINNENGKERLNELFDHKLPFDFPKSIELIKKCIVLGTNENDIILDSFAGSGTTMDATFDFIHETEQNRKCIIVQMKEENNDEPDKNICKDVTRERVKRAIDKFGYESGFKYYRVGIPLDAETMLAGQLPTYKQFAKYVYYLCTGENLEKEDSINEETYFVSEFGKQAIYLVYKQDYDTLTHLALNFSMAERIKQKQHGKKRIVYAPSCFLDEEYLTENQIDYVGIPYNLFQRNKE